MLIWRFTSQFISVSFKSCQSYTSHFWGAAVYDVQRRWAKRRALNYEKFQPCPAWLLLGKTGPPFSPSLYSVGQINEALEQP